MNNKNLIIGGVIVAGLVAYYFYNKNKGSGLASSSSPIEPIVSTVSSNMPKWRLKRDVINGMIPDLAGGRGIAPPRQNILFKKGDIIQGNIEAKIIFNKNSNGISALPTISGAYFTQTPFVLIDDLEEVK